MINGGMTTIYVSEMERAVEFYSQTLGLKVTYRAGNDYCGLDAGEGLKLGLHPTSKDSPQPGDNGSTIVGFNVSVTMEEIVEALEAKGVTFKGPIADDANGGIRLAFFADPDGNDLYLCESRWKG